VQPETRPFAFAALQAALSGVPRARPTPPGDPKDPSESRADPQPPLFKKGTCCRFT